MERMAAVWLAGKENPVIVFQTVVATVGEWAMHTSTASTEASTMDVLEEAGEAVQKGMAATRVTAGGLSSTTIMAQPAVAAVEHMEMALTAIPPRQFNVL